MKAIVLNLLSVGAACGVLVALFQWGWGESFLGFQSNGGIASWLPIFMFVMVFRTLKCHTCDKRRRFGSLSDFLARKRSPPGTPGLAVLFLPPRRATPRLCGVPTGSTNRSGLGQPALGVAEAVGWWKPPRVMGGRQILTRVNGESPSISRQIRAPAVNRRAPSVTQIEVIGRGQRSWTAMRPVSSIRAALERADELDLPMFDL